MPENGHFSRNIVTPRTLRPLALVLLGTLIGWVVRGLLAPPHTLSPSTVEAALPAQSIVNSVSVLSQPGPADLADSLSNAKRLALAANAGLGNQAFGEKLAALLTGKKTLIEQLEAESMKEALSPDRCLAFYKALAKRTKIHQQYQELNDVLTSVGQKYGWTAMEPFLKEFPEGFERWDSMIHGWAMKEPTAATEWFNKLPEGQPRSIQALNGLVWGLAVSDGNYAGSVLLNLSPNDRSAVIDSFADSFVIAHGPEEFEKWCQSVDPSIANKALACGANRVAEGPPEQAVAWFARHVDQLGLQGDFVQSFDQWVASDPSAARIWLETLPPTQSQSTQLREMLGSRFPSR